MILKSILVRDYKNIRNSGEVRIEDDVTCLVGKNESGKSATLQALYRLNPLGSGHPETFSGLRDYPRRHYRADRERIAATRPITAVFELGDEDVRAVEDAHGEGVLASRSVTVARTYENELVWEAEARGDLASPVRDVLRERLPAFLYFDEYSVMAGRISIPRLQAGDGRGLEPGERTALALLRSAAGDLRGFTETGYEERKISLEAAANRITDDVLRYWSQDPDLSVEFDLDSVGKGAGAEAQFIDVRVRNRRHRITLNFSERSRGFTWFFSFLAMLSGFGGPRRMVLLLDEPGLGLHAEAQYDLRRFIDERLAPVHQVVYTTHSPFMIPSTALRRVRTLEDRKEKGTVVSGDLAEHSADTRIPLRAAMGYSLTRSLRIGSDALIVREPSDHVFLTVMSGLLEQHGRACLDPRWTIVPAGGLAGVSMLAALLGALPNTAILAGAAGEEARTGDPPIARALAGDGCVIHLPEIAGAREADVEDLFAADFYVELVNRSGAAVVEWFEVLGEGRIAERIRSVTGAPYNRYLPARLLMEGGAELLTRVDGETLDRFETLFGRINESLGAGARP